MVDIHTVGAGGGSVVWRDDGGALRVGPRSAGANPGPACYARGGTAGTVTDANLLFGRLPPRLPGGLELDAAAAERALRGIDPEAVVEVVNAEMLRALRVVSVERGHDPRDFALVAFGGAGPLHACALADELGSRKVLVPDAAGVFSALGLAASDERRDHVRSYVASLTEVDPPAGDGDASLRYRGQSFELTVPLGDELEERFHVRTRSATATPTGRARSSSWPCVRSRSSRRRRYTSLPAAARSVSGPALVELAGRDVLGARRLGGSDRRTRDARAGAAVVTGAISGRAAGDRQRAARDRRGDGRGADPRGVLLQHQGAA